MSTRQEARRRWVMRVKDDEGRDRWLVLAVPRGSGGQITVSTGSCRLLIEPEQLSRLRGIALHVVATAVEDRGAW